MSSENLTQSSFEKKVSLTTSLIAVALSISTIYSSVVGDDLLISRGAANNAWSYFQSKSIKQNFFDAQAKILCLELAKPEISSEYRQKVEAQVNEFTFEVERYAEEKNKIKAEALAHEAVYKKSDKRGNVLNYAEALYQISIILSAISLMAHSRKMWLVSIGFGTLGFLLTLLVYFFL